MLVVVLFKIVLRVPENSRFNVVSIFRSQAMKCLERSLEIKEMVVDSDDLSVGQSLHYLADLYVLLGNLE